MSLPTASALPRVFACPQSHRLPQQALPPSEAGATGTAIHLWLSDGILPEDPEALAACEAISQALPDAQWRHEVALAYDLTNDWGRELGMNLGRAYGGAKPTEWVGTVDGVAIIGGVATVLELKTGWRPVSLDSWQVRFLALAAARAAGTSEAEVVLLVAHPDGAFVRRARFDALALDETAMALEQLATRLQKDSPTVPGDHCRYCPAMASCPSVLGIVRALSIVDGDISKMKPTNAKTAGAMLEVVNVAKAALGRIQGELEAFALREPLQLPDGRTWGWREKPKMEFLPGAATVLRNEYGDKGARAVTESVSKTSITKALGKKDGEAAINELRVGRLVVEKMVGGFGFLKGGEDE